MEVDSDAIVGGPPLTSSSLILFGPLPPPVNGTTLAFKMLVDGCASRGMPCEVVNFSPTGISANSFFPDLLRFVDYAFIMARYLKVVRTTRNGVVYVTLNQAISGIIRDVMLIFLARHSGQRVVVHIHGGCYDQVLCRLPGPLRSMVVRALSKCETIVIESDRLRTMFREFPRLQPLLKVVPNGLPMSVPKEVPPKSIDRSRPVKLLFLSHFIESKGWWEILEAVEILANSGISIEATFCGEFLHFSHHKRFPSPHEARQAFEGFQKKLEPKARIIRLPTIQGEDLERVLLETHFLLLPSWFPNEGQPTALIDGLAFGCVLIGTDYRALGDMIRPGRTGFLIPAHPSAIAECIADMVGNPEEFRKLSIGSVDLFRSEFTPEKHVERLLAIVS